ncbi:hypothetical protein ACQQ2N_12135 [Dokdonella sp. MW10]|uniref:hypothetical protein n=1 Tax=Dokdonella sp. MW10 TaxID=2992926 RepID=UPI003F7E4811
MINLFCGYDPREAIGFHVFAHSVISRASVPVAITPLASMGLPQGTNAFTMSRFLVPWLCGYRGRAIFADASDMVMLDDIANLDALFDPRLAVQVVQHPKYQTRHPRKYVGTPMEAENRSYARKNWASLMLINCGHPVWKDARPEVLAKESVVAWLMMVLWDAAGEDQVIGELPREWNVLVDEGQDDTNAKILHWTAGIPAFHHYRNAPHADTWRAERAAMESAA